MELGEAGDGEKQEGGEGLAGIRCLRCTKKGHIAARCTTDIYCVICDSHEHVNHKCPILKMPRPVAHAVGYAVHGLGFYHIQRPPLVKAKRDSKTAIISVEGGHVSKEVVHKQLERLFPGKWVWELVEHEENSFLTKFPSKLELQRAVAFGSADIKGVGVQAGARVKFDVWHEKEVGFLLPKVWVRVFGIRKELREFLELWVVGSLLGSTQTVDMETTRKNEFGRIFVAVLNPSLIPSQLDVVIGDHYFELEFEVEKLGINENREEAVIEWNRGSNSEEGRETAEGEGLVESKELGREAKRQKKHLVQGENSGTAENNTSKPFVDTLKEQVQGMSKEEFEAFLREKALEIINGAAKVVIDEIADEVAGEKEEEHIF